MRKRISTWLVALGVMGLIGSGSAGIAAAQHGADDPAGHHRHGLDDGARHHKRHHRHHHRRADDGANHDRHGDDGAKHG